jgi:hypothetical protein
VAKYVNKKQLLAATGFTSAGTTTGTWKGGFTGCEHIEFALTVSGKSIGAGDTVDVYIQTLLPDGSAADDVVHFTQITNAAMGNGTYVARITQDNAGFVDRASTDGTLAANGKRDYFCDNLRVKVVVAGVTGGETITLQLDAIGASE